MRIAIISDLHIGPYAKTKELCVPPSHKAMDVDILGQFEEFVRRESVTAEFLIIAGDISETGKPDELMVASDVVTKIANILGVPKERIAYTPGNHDKDWRCFEEGKVDIHGVRNIQSYIPLAMTPSIFKEINETGREGIITNQRWAVWDYDKLQIISYNTSWYDAKYSDIHHGLFNPADVAPIANAVNGRPADCYRIMLVHHHPIEYTNPWPTVDVSILANAESLITLCADAKIDLLVHGHKHCPRYGITYAASRRHIGVLCAGSFSKALDPSQQGEVLNQFHLIEFEGRVPETDCAYGCVYSWCHHPTKGWEVGEAEYAGIDHKNPFGYNGDDLSIKEHIAIICKQLQQRDWIKWQDVVNEKPELARISARVVDSVLKTLAQEGIFEYKPERNGNHILLFR